MILVDDTGKVINRGIHITEVESEVRKKLKLPLLSEKIDGIRTYRIGTGKAAKTKKTAAARKA